MERIIIQNKCDVTGILQTMRRDLQEICKSHFRFDLVTKESWERDPSSRISFSKDKIPMLKEAGVMKDPSDYSYGWHFPNSHYAECANSLHTADKLIVDILNYLRLCNIRPKQYEYSELELSRFEVIEGGGNGSWLVSRLKEGALL